jgi:hypothetical protein
VSDRKFPVFTKTVKDCAPVIPFNIPGQERPPNIFPSPPAGGEGRGEGGNHSQPLGYNCLFTSFLKYGKFGFDYKRKKGFIKI